MTRAPSLRVVTLFCAILVLCLMPRSASAALTLCNRTSYIVYASTGEAAVPEMVTRGWTRIVPGACETAIAGRLTAPVYFTYARTSQAHDGPARAWGGRIALCVKDTNFALKTPLGADRCQTDDAFAVPFAPISRNDATSWTMTFTQSPALPSLEAARTAGIARLLSDIGYKVGHGHGLISAIDALNKFRVRMKISASANSADLFDALETDALKVSAPAGYSICNDTDAPVWAALGLRNGKDWTSRGWWKVLPGGCARAIAARLSADKIYLLVEGKASRKLVSGTGMFCVTSITFDIRGRDRCAERGLAAAGFALTVTKGLSGFAAHVSENGLLPSLHLAD